MVRSRGGQELQCWYSDHCDQVRDINIDKLYKVTEIVVRVLCVLCDQKEKEMLHDLYYLLFMNSLMLFKNNS